MNSRLTENLALWYILVPKPLHAKATLAISDHKRCLNGASNKDVNWE